MKAWDGAELLPCKQCQADEWDPDVQRMLAEADQQDQRGGLLRLLRRAAQKAPKPLPG